eukprot:TRINITY_DN2483_c0_g1_i1.p1 TRINITY_DN2483_c0_g1~~TRINITY_DN2483_c0_g1_i1.p1  ORF type:complete len:277 (+),score=31.75 TRINITY_DN2483_c0_g1_i1:44-874(+)
MDLIIQLGDEYIFNYIYPATWPAEDFWRQTLSLYLIVTIGAYILYFTIPTLDYIFLYDKKNLTDKRILKNQIRKEIFSSCTSIPIMGIYSVPFYMLEVRGYTKLYSNVEEYGIPYMLFSAFLYIAFTDGGIYWIHRFLHTFPWLYKNIHKEHHKWIVITPYAALAFHPIDGTAQSIPYLIFPWFFPIHKVLYVSLYFFVMLWTIGIHDKISFVRNSVVNGSAHHNLHHTHYSYNYGQFFTLWDRLGGSFRQPKWDKSGVLIDDDWEGRKSESKKTN